MIDMADDYEIIDVGEYFPNPEAPCWYVTMRKPDGSVLQHFFPKNIFEWRAAEYGLTDPAEILDVVLHERHRPREISNPARSLVNPAPKKAAPKRPTLWDATSTNEARAVHRAAMTEAKQQVQVIDPAGHLAHIINDHGITANGVRAKAEHVDVQRWRMLYGGLPVEPTTKEALSA